MLKLLVGLLLISLLAGCATNDRACPEFPLPSSAVQAKMDALAQDDREVWEWGNKLLDLCIQLGTCEEGQE